ncbi:MAG: class I SAM-dependent methyltransferase [Acidimicrobiia bacterium]|nr:class I SAM-dependent methyltransferase [Acidimicrobiia bacterium]
MESRLAWNVRAMRLVAYAALMFMFTPLLLPGLVFYMVPIVASRGRVSGTAYAPFVSRLFYHLVGSRPDPAALALATGLPATNRVVMVLLMKPFLWAARLSGHLPNLLEYPAQRPTPFFEAVAARCEFFDQALLTQVVDGAQVVILGAGWDTRSYGLLAGRSDDLFEVDAPATQAVKRAAVEKAGLDASGVVFVPCDFNRQSWLDALKNHGFDSDKRTVILWEGVTMYLQKHAIDRTFGAVADLPAGSSIAFDFFSREWLESAAGKRSRRVSKLIYGEPWTFGFPVLPDFADRLHDYLDHCGLALSDYRPLGEEAKGALPYGGLVLASKPA